MKTDFKCAADAARNIVLVMVRRSRMARRCLRKAEAADTPQSVLDLLSARASEAHNAAESARRVYYHGMDAL